MWWLPLDACVMPAITGGWGRSRGRLVHSPQAWFTFRYQCQFRIARLRVVLSRFRPARTRFVIELFAVISSSREREREGSWGVSWQNGSFLLFSRESEKLVVCLEIVLDALWFVRRRRKWRQFRQFISRADWSDFSSVIDIQTPFGYSIMRLWLGKFFVINYTVPWSGGGALNRENSQK